MLARTGITATAGIGPNLFLAKVALDITAKHEDDGIGELDEERFRQDIWRHRPITDIWGIGPGTAERLARYRVYDLMGVAALDSRILYREFGVNAEYLIDHAHGIEPCTIAEIQAYRPQATSMVNGQVLSRNYSYDEALTVLREVVDASVLELVERSVVASSISLYVGYGSEVRELRRLEFGVNAEYLIDHAHGIEPCTIAEIQAYRPQASSMVNGQVLSRNYSYEEALTVLREMVDASVLELVDQGVVASSISLYVGYGSDVRELRRLDASGSASYVDGCGHRRSTTAEDIPRITPRPGENRIEHSWPPERDLYTDGMRRGGSFTGEHGTRPAGGKGAYAHAGKQRKLHERTNSRRKLKAYFEQLYTESVDPRRPIKRVNIGFGDLLPEELATIDLFTDVEAEAREHDLQRAIIDVKGRYGKNALVMGRSLRPEATGRERNEQVGGHHA